MTREVADLIRIRARHDAYKAIATDPQRDCLEQLRRSGHPPVIALIAAHTQTKQHAANFTLPDDPA